ncbi:MAG: hypothetical protein RLZZ129_1682 [Verrucomicrobiota bacterium]
MVVLFFKRILNFTQEAAAQREQRHAERYPVATDSPLQARLEISGRQHTGQLVNLSSTGASIRLPTELAADRGAAGRLELTLEQHTLTIPVKVAHYQPGARDTVLGLQLLFGDFDAKKGYLQLLEPVAIGAGLRAGDPQLVREKERGLNTTLYHGPGDTLLTVWSNFAGQAIQGFELRMHDYFVRSGPTPPALEVFLCEEQTAEHKLGYRVPALKRAGEENAEIIRLFRWVLPNLNRKLPEDVREFLARFTPAKD